MYIEHGSTFLFFMLKKQFAHLYNVKRCAWFHFRKMYIFLCPENNLHTYMMYKIFVHMMQIHSSSQRYPPVTRSLETLEILFEKISLNKKVSFIVGQHFDNIFLLRQQIETKNNKCKKIRDCWFWS